MIWELNYYRNAGNDQESCRKYTGNMPEMSKNVLVVVYFLFWSKRLCPSGFPLLLMQRVIY